MIYHLTLIYHLMKILTPEQAEWHSLEEAVILVSLSSPGRGVFGGREVEGDR